MLHGHWNLCWLRVKEGNHEEKVVAGGLMQADQLALPSSLLGDLERGGWVNQQMVWQKAIEPRLVSVAMSCVEVQF